MAPSNPVSGLIDQLVASILPDSISASKQRKYTETFSRKLKSQSYPSPDQFEVAERLDRLQEKSRILNNDELADAIHDRLVKLKHFPDKSFADILDLLLHLSENPVTKTRIEWLANSDALPPVLPPLRWTEFEAHNPVDGQDQIWRVPEYSDLSSDDDIVGIAPKTSTTSNIILSHGEEEECFPHIDLGSVDPGLGLEALDLLSANQFWRNISGEKFELTEIQVIREVLFMLQGLPTALFWEVGDQLVIDQRFRLNTSTRESLEEVLSGFGQIAIRLDLLRTFIREPRSEQVLQRLRSGLEGILHHIDSQLFTLEQNILAMITEAPSTLLHLVTSVSDIVEATGSLADFVADIQPKGVDMIQCLDLLFDRVCQLRASGGEPGCHSLSTLFLQCFQLYFLPLRDWMDQGTLPEDQAKIFVVGSPLIQDKSGLWQKWYELADDTAANRCPKFMQPFKAQILNTGKTIVFLRHLNTPIQSPVEYRGTPPPQESVFTDADSLLPFSECLAASVQELVQSRLQLATRTLRDCLGGSCGLWNTLTALNRIYFGGNGYIMDSVDVKIFAAIDRCDRNWNDRFLLRELLQTAFEPMQFVEVERLAVKSSPQSSRNMPSRRQSVKLLNGLRIQYTLPWSIANIINRKSLARYQTISTFLTQIRRGRYMLERRSLLEVRSGRLGATKQERNCIQSLHHDLLLFVNTLYNHLTSLVIEGANVKLRRDLSDAVDIDAMIAAHERYSTDLEDACLVAKKLRPIHDEIISILDLCIRFSDFNYPVRSRRSSNADADADSYVSAWSHQHRRRGKGEEDTSADEDVDIDDGQGYSTFIVPDESGLEDRLREMREGFQRHLSFVVAGLNGIAKVGGRGGFWEMLASRLSWKRIAF